MNTIDRTDNIDNYLLSNMSSEEKKEFERLLFTSSTTYDNRTTLKDEMNLQKDLILAIQARGLKEQLINRESVLRAKKRKVQHIIKLTCISSSTIAIAAMIAICIILVPMAQMMPNISSKYTNTITLSEYRGGSDIFQENLQKAYLLISNKQWKEANVIIKDLQKELGRQTNLSNEENKEMQDQALWIHTMCEMQLKHVIRAKHLLQRIAKSDSRFSEQAQSMLDELSK